MIDPGENELDALADVSIKTNDLEALNGLIAKAPQFAEAAELIGAAKQIVIVYGKGVVAYSEPIVFEKLIELAKSIGAKLIGVKGEANSFAAAQLKLDRPFALNGHQAVYVAMGDDFVTERLDEAAGESAVPRGAGQLCVEVDGHGRRGAARGNVGGARRPLRELGRARAGGAQSVDRARTK